MSVEILYGEKLYSVLTSTIILVQQVVHQNNENRIGVDNAFEYHGETSKRSHRLRSFIITSVILLMTMVSTAAVAGYLEDDAISGVGNITGE